MEDMSKMVNKAIIPPHRSDCGCGLCLTKRAADKVADIIQSTKEAHSKSAN